MDREQWQQVEAIVDTALAMEREKRAAYVEEACGDNKRLKKSVTELLDSIQESAQTHYLENPDRYREFEADLAKSTGDSLVGQQLDVYKITDLIGHGGMGSVYRARRADGLHDQPVALKVLPRGMDSPSNIARFQRERQILGKLDHPNIARLLDGGVTGDGRPYLVMEYVDGNSLFDYCNEHQLSVAERLALFETICRAVQHAHRKTVIHRDLKPSNILVTANGTVKVLDFGIAKLLDPGDPEKTLFQTRSGARVFTLGYAAPEQIEGNTVQTTSDTYGLGILLYELLTGQHPFHLEGKNLTEIEQLIRKQTPDPPSRKFKKLSSDEQSEIARQRSTTPSALIHLLGGDLNAIIMKALRKEPEARYGSAEQLMEDLKRREKHHPILARKDTWRYRATKFVKRHKNQLAVAAGFALLLVSFAGFYTWQITEERDRARREAEKARQISDFLVNTFQAGNPNVKENDSLTAKELLDRGLEKINTLDDELIKSQLLIVLGKSYKGIGDYQKAGELFKKAIQLNHQTKQKSRKLTYANALYELGHMRIVQQSFKEAAPYIQKAYDIQSRELGNNNSNTLQTLSELGVAYRNIGRLDSAEHYTRKAVAAHKQNPANSDSSLLRAKANLAYVLRKKQKYREAEKLYKEVITQNKAETPTDKSFLTSSYNNLAYLYREQKNYAKAEKYYHKALELSSEIKGEAHPLTNMIRKNLATALTSDGKLKKAAYYWDQNIEQIQKRFSKKHWRTASAHTSMGYFLILKQQNYKQAQQYIEEGIEIYEEVLGSDHTWTAYAKGLLTGTEYLMNNSQASDSLFQVHYNIFRNNMNSLDRTNKGQIRKLMDIYITQGDTINEEYVTAYQQLLDTK